MTTKKKTQFILTNDAIPSKEKSNLTRIRKKNYPENQLGFNQDLKQLNSLHLKYMKEVLLQADIYFHLSLYETLFKRRESSSPFYSREKETNSEKKQPRNKKELSYNHTKPSKRQWQDFPNYSLGTEGKSPCRANDAPKGGERGEEIPSTSPPENKSQNIKSDFKEDKKKKFFRNFDKTESS